MPEGPAKDKADVDREAARTKKGGRRPDATTVSSGEGGEIRIHNDVIGIIAGQAASEVAGVRSMSAGIADGLAKRLTGRSMEKGIRIERDGDSVKLEISVVVEYGQNIPQVAREIQERVKARVEHMTGKPVMHVKVTVHGIHFRKEGEDAPEPGIRASERRAPKRETPGQGGERKEQEGGGR